MKKFLGLLAAALLAASCSQPLLDTSSAVSAPLVDRALTSAAAPVVFFSEGDRSFYVYHGISGVERTYNIVVANLAYTKAVNIRFEMADGTWKDYPASFVQSLPENQELWQVKTSGYDGWGYVPFSEFGKKFAVNYTVNGVTYWDNNNGANYTDSGAYLRAGINIHRAAPALGFTNTVVLRNLAFTKKVNVTYSFDNWKTSTTAPCSFFASVAGTDLEKWSFSVPPYYVSNPDGTSTQLFAKYYFSYEVNGQTFWDSNFGANYTSN